MERQIAPSILVIRTMISPFVVLYVKMTNNYNDIVTKYVFLIQNKLH